LVAETAGVGPVVRRGARIGAACRRNATEEAHHDTSRQQPEFHLQRNFNRFWFSRDMLGPTSDLFIVRATREGEKKLSILS
jgi:hypothetical protein